MSRVATCRANAPARAEVVNQSRASRNLCHKRLIVDARSFDFPAAYEHPTKARVILGSSEFPATRFAMDCNFATQPLSEIFAHEGHFNGIVHDSYRTRDLIVRFVYDLQIWCPLWCPLPLDVYAGMCDSVRQASVV
jgi:hypothetical protein